MNDVNDYVSLVMYQTRQKELMEVAEKHRLATLQNEIARRVRQAVSIKNERQS